jgi:hypothetical protein
MPIIPAPKRLRQEIMSSRPAWTTYQFQGQPVIHRETLSQNKQIFLKKERKKTKNEQTKK